MRAGPFRGEPSLSQNLRWVYGVRTANSKAAMRSAECSMAGPPDQMRLSSTFSDNGDVRQKNLHVYQRNLQNFALEREGSQAHRRFRALVKRKLCQSANCARSNARACGLSHSRAPYILLKMRPSGPTKTVSGRRDAPSMRSSCKRSSMK
jgi:hypothetical protein